MSYCGLIDAKIRASDKDFICTQAATTDPCAPISDTAANVHDPYCCYFPECCGERPEDWCAFLDLEEQFELFDFDDDNYNYDNYDNYDYYDYGFDDFGVSSLVCL